MKTTREQSLNFFFQSPDSRRGFTLIEIIIVTFILTILAALGVPALLRSRLQSNESAAIGNLRTLSSSAESFRSTQNPPAYAAVLDAMINSNPPYLDTTWQSGSRQGYTYVYAAIADQSAYSMVATPEIPNDSGINSYCVDHTGIIRRYNSGTGNPGGAAGCNTAGNPV